MDKTAIIQLFVVLIQTIILGGLTLFALHRTTKGIAALRKDLKKGVASTEEGQSRPK